MNTRGQTATPWTVKAPQLSLPSLSRDLTCDVCVVGGGITGLTTAYLAVKAGLSVVVLEADEIGAGESGRTTAHFVTAHDNRYFSLRRIHGAKRTRLIADSLVRCLDTVEEIVHNEHIECDLERLPGYLYLNPRHGYEQLKWEQAAALAAGLTGVELVDQICMGQKELGPALGFPGQLQLHMTQYLAGLVQAILRQGGQVFTHSRMAGITGQSPVEIQTDNGPKVKARWVVQATNSPAYASLFQFAKQPPMRTYVVGARVPKRSMTSALFWETGSPYHYTRLQTTEDPNFDWLLVGGEDHRTGVCDDGQKRFEKLEKYVQEIVPSVTEIDFHWSGQVLESLDGLPFIGPYKKMSGVLYATGDSGMGMTHGTIAAMMLTNRMLGKQHPWDEIYAPDRWRLLTTWPFIKEGATLSWLYTKGWLGSASHIPKNLPNRQGVIVKSGKQRLAVYKDKTGQLITRSAVCPHLKCVVSWNSTEQTWDCPCHGSRFEASGNSISAPTLGRLVPKKLDFKSKKR